MIGGVLVKAAAACGAQSSTAHGAALTVPHVFFISGESNAEAFKGTDSPAGYPDATIPLLSRIGPPGPPSWFYDSGSTPLSLGPAGGFRGMELTAATALKAAGYQMKVIKVSVNGSLQGDWAKGNANGYYQSLVDAITLGKSLWGSNVATHFVWLIGVNDAEGTLANSLLFEGYLRQFVADTKADIGWTDFWGIKLQPGALAFVPEGPTVAAAIATVMAERSDTFLLDLDSVTDPGIAHHFVPSELNAMGIVAANAIMARH